MEEKRMTKQDAIYHDLKNKILSGYYQYSASVMT